MTFIAELENTVRALYLHIIIKKYPKGVTGKTLNCDSFRKIVATIKSVLIDCSNNGLAALETANNIIFKLLQEKFFAYENHQAALSIGYVYLKRQGVKVTNYSVDAITDNSTIEEIRALTITW
jgi:prophage maintenance system killer protein